MSHGRAVTDDNEITSAPSATVVSAAIFRDRTRRELLLAVRRPTQLVRRHPGVLSTVTYGVPGEVFNILHKATAKPLRLGDIVRIDHYHEIEVGNGAYLNDTHSFVLEHLLARKVGLAKPLVNDDFYATAEPILSSFENVDDPLGTGQCELTRMLTYAVVIERGADLIPESTDSYSRFVWVAANDVGRAVAQRDPLILNDTLNPIEVCIHGLCVRSIAVSLEGKLGNN